MEIKKGKYNLAERNLSFEITDDLDFENSDKCYYFRGGNGFGKTSFLEKIIIPCLKTHHQDYIYIGQDIRTQLYTLRALLSVRGYKVSNTDECELLRLWINHSRSASVLIMDEFDKYFPDYGFIFDWSEPFVQTYIIVTHLGYHPLGAAAKKNKMCHVRFELINFDGHLKNVRVKKEKTWSF
jgi:hypothetical protein